MSTESPDFTLPLSHTSALPEFKPSALLATRIWYADCFQFRSLLSLCQERCGVALSIPRGLRRCSHRSRPGAGCATTANIGTRSDKLMICNRLTVPSMYCEAKLHHRPDTSTAI